MLVLCGCEDTVKYINTKPSGLSIAYQKCYVAAGGTVSLSGAASDSDDDELSFKWSASAGSFVPASGAGQSVIWVAPESYGPVVITMTVTDGYDSVSKQQTITVCELLPSSIIASRSIANAGHIYITRSDGPLLIAGSATVTIEPGVTIVADLGLGGILSYGRIVAVGTASQKIRIMQNSCTGEDGLWTGISFEQDQAEGVLRYCEISGSLNGISASYGARLDIAACQIYKHEDFGLSVSFAATAEIRGCSIWDNGIGVYVEDATVSLDRNSIRYNSAEGVFLTASQDTQQATIDSCVVANNYTNGFVIADNAQPEIHYCSIFSNGDAGPGCYAIKLSASWISTINAENNFWGINDATEQEIAALIYDALENPELAIVDFTPWLSYAPVAMPAEAEGADKASWAR